MSGISRGPFIVSAQKRALIEAKLREEGLIPADADTIQPRAYPGPAPLSFAQQRLWFFDQFEPGSSLYNLMSPVLFEGDLDPAALEGAFNSLIERHEALRTTFDFRDGQPVQIISPAQPLKMSHVDLTGLHDQEQQHKMRSLIRIEAERPFGLKHGPLLRMTLLHLADRKHVLLLAVHHIVCDAWSTAVMIRELGTFYAVIKDGRSALLPRLPIQYADFAAWQRQWLQGAVLERQLEYWKAKLGDGLPVLELPADKPRAAVQTFHGSCVSFTVPHPLFRSLKALAQSERATLFMLLLAAFKVLLSRYTGLEDITVGTPIANRQRHEVEHLIGFFTNTLALRTKLAANLTFHDLLKGVRENLLDAYAHQDLPFEYLVEKLHPQRSLSHSPLVQVMFVVRNTPEQELKFPGVTATAVKSGIATAKFDLSVYLDESGDRIDGEIEYNTDLFEQARVERMSAHFLTLLTSIVQNPAELISGIRLLTDAEEQQLLQEWNRTQRPYRRACVHELFEQQVESSPNATALLSEQGALTYAELNCRANRIAHRLRKLGARPGAAVAILMERSPEMIAGVLGILKTGAACLPLNPSYPAQRLAFVLEDSGAVALLTDQKLSSILLEPAMPVVCVDASEPIEKESNEVLPSPTDPESGCYIIYTSGSTGTPKGVVMPHRALVNLVEWHRATSSKSNRVLQFASLTFDVSFQEIFSTFALGGTLVLAPEPARVDMKALGRFVAENNIERFHLPVVVLQRLAEEFCENPQPLSSLRELMVGGEQLQISRPIARLFEQLSDCALYNHYGPSETHVVTSYLMRQSPAIWPSLPPLGRPIANVRAYVLDTHLRPVPVGVTGELYLSGDCLAHGYLKRPALTGERFIPDPFSSVPGERMYKTGDLVRYAGCGDIEFIGRNDSQVKIRGMRIELPEIELALAAHPGVREAVVIVHQDGSANEKRLAGYIVPQPGAAITPKQLRDYLRERLPEHMVPFHLTTLSSFPLTSSGKINRLALPVPEKSVEAAEGYVEPQTAVERVLAGIFAEVVGASRVGLHDNFFDLGGHSLMATQIAARVREAFRIELPVRAIFGEPTVGGLARFVLLDEANRRRIERTAEVLSEFSEPALEQGGLSAMAKQLPNGDAKPAAAFTANATKLYRPAGVSAPKRILRTAPLSFAQQRLWFLDQYDPQSTLYNLPAALRLQGQLNVDALQQSLNEIVRRHESLRTIFDISNERPVQIIQEASSKELTITDLEAVPADELQGVLNRLILEEAERPFDLGKGPLLRTQLLRISATDHVFLVTMHHIVSDGWSIQLFIRELAVLYDANCRKVDSSLPELPMQYADFAGWQREWLQGAALSEQLEYWKKRLADAPQLLELPADRPRPVYKTFNGAALLFEVPQALAQQIARLGRVEGTTLFMTLLSAFYVLLYRYTGQEDIVVGTPIANRTRRDVEELIGFFVNTLVLRVRLWGEMSFCQLLQEVREICLEAYTHQDVPFEKLVEKLHPERNLSHSPLFQAVFHLQNVLNEQLHLAGLSVDTVQTDITKAKFDLSFAMSESANGLTAILNYNTDLFDADTIRRIAVHFQNLLQSAVRNPKERISGMPILSPAEQKQILMSWNDFRNDYGRERLIHEVLTDQARRRPNAVAVKFENATLTYAELNRHANQLAHHLRQLGVGPEQVVGICVQRSLEMMIGLFGILKSGAAYLPLDPGYPKGRLASMLDDAGVEVLVTQEAAAKQLPDRGERRIYLDIRNWVLENESSEDPVGVAQPENLAYLIYTSGSTGRPKGIMVEHRMLANYVGWASETIFDNAGEPVPAVQALTFDGSLKQIFAPLPRGIEVWLLSETEVTDPVALIHALSAHRNIPFSSVPSLWKAILDVLESGQAILPDGVITRAFIGGEELPKTLVERTFALLPDLLLWNCYGPSEITATATAGLIRPGEQITLGKPIAGKKVHILDAQLNPVPIGVAGEIYVGREGLARGYVRLPDLTAASFIPDPFSDKSGARLYRTRDKARYLADGRIEFLGRLDHQVKVRGFRIELGEIEAVLGEHSEVKEAVVLTKHRAEGEQQIVAYVVPVREQAPGVAELRAFLKDRLPEYMVPSFWVMLDRLPLTANGKLNRSALPEPDLKKRDLESLFVRPRTALEETVAKIFAEVLDMVEQVGIHDNFFQLGGHSLLATRVVGRIRKKLKAELKLRDFFEGPTVAEIAEALTAHEPRLGQLEETAALLRKIDSLSVDDLEELLRQKRQQR